jgi:hypothetical protein
MNFFSVGFLSFLSVFDVSHREEHAFEKKKNKE